MRAHYGRNQMDGGDGEKFFYLKALEEQLNLSFPGYRWANMLQKRAAPWGSLFISPSSASESFPHSCTVPEAWKNNRDERHHFCLRRSCNTNRVVIYVDCGKCLRGGTKKICGRVRKKQDYVLAGRLEKCLWRSAWCGAERVAGYE